MNEKADARLDDLLQSWADQQRADEDHVEVLRERILSQLTAEVQTIDVDVMPAATQADVSHPHRRWRNAALVSMALAALLVIALFVVSSAKRDDTTPQSARRAQGRAEAISLPPDFAWLSDDQLASKRSLLQEMDRVFSDRLTWIAETNGQVEMGLVEDEQSANASARSLAIRIVVIRKTPDNAAGVPVWAVDLLTRNEQLVHVSPRNSNDATLLLWAFVMPDGNIAIDSDLRLPGSDAMHPSTATVQKPGEPREVYSQRQGDAEYVVYQTVSVL